MSPRQREALRWFALLVGLPLVALTLVVLGDLVPDRFVAYRLRDAIVTGQIDEASYEVGSTGGQIDGFSECKRVTVGLGAPEGMSTLESAVRSPTLGSCESAVPKILAWADGEGLSRSYDYFRYWNGSAVVLRPSVAAFGIGGTRLLIAGALAAVTYVWWRRAAKRVGALGPAFLVAAVVLTTDAVDLPRALVHGVGVTVAVAAAAAMLFALRETSTVSSFAAAGFSAGAAFQFFGDLTNPDAAWALATVSAGVIVVGSPELRRAAGRTVAASAGWLLGFAWIWFTKWVVAALVIGYDTVRFVIGESAQERLAGDVWGADATVVSGLSAAWRAWRDQPLFVPAVAGLIVASVVVGARSGDFASTWPRRVLLAAPALLPVAWHLVMRNHTAVHFWFTYRSFAVALGILALSATARIVVDARPEDRGAHDAEGFDDDLGQAQYGSTASGSMS